MHFDISKSIEILERTPEVLYTLLQGLSPEWVNSNEGAGTWSVYDVIGHLIHGEKTDWIPRMQIILSGDNQQPFPSFDRFAQLKDSKGKSLDELLDEFAQLRKNSIALLRAAQLTESQLAEKGMHPVFGPVTLAELLATWTVHDLNHLAQINRVMAKQYTAAVGPWIAYLRILG